MSNQDNKMKEEFVSFKSDELKLAGVLRYPEGCRDIPCMLLIHGTLEQDRNGNMLVHPDGRKVHKKNFFLQISKHLCPAGFATFSWDKRGFGESEGSYTTLSAVRDAKAALNVLCNSEIVDSKRIAVFAQSAGVYTACLLAKEDNRPKVFILSGGLFSDYSDMMAFNYLRVKEYAEKSKENRLWVEKNDIWGFIVGSNLELIEKAAREGKTKCEIKFKNRIWRIPVEPLLYKEEYAPSKQFKYLKKPVLLLHGECDLNVPVEDVYRIEKALKVSNKDVELVTIPNADHSFQEVAKDEETRLRERMSLESFKRPYKPEFFNAMVEYLKRRL